MKSLPIHAMAEVFPPMGDDEFASFKRDIERHGVHIPVAVWQGAVVDGRNRARACEELGIECPTREVTCTEDELPSLIWSLNSERRHLTESQRGMIAARMANLLHGSNQFQRKEETYAYVSSDDRPKKISVDEAARVAKVGPSMVDIGLRVLRSGDETLAESVDKGDTTLYKARRVLQERDRKEIPVEAKRPGVLPQKSAFADPDTRRDRPVLKSDEAQFANAVQALDVAAEVLCARADVMRSDVRRNEFSETLRRVRTMLTRVIHSMEAAA